MQGSPPTRLTGPSPGRWGTVWPGSGAPHRKVAILAGSAVLHALILGWLAISVVGPDCCLGDPLPRTPVYLELAPRPQLPGETAHVRPPVPRPRAAETLPLTGSTTADPRNPLRKTTAPAESPPAPLMPRSAGAPPAGANPWTYRPETAGAAIGRSLRQGPIGCQAMWSRMTPVEQSLCDDRFNAGAADAAARHPLGARTLTPSEQRREDQFAREGAAALQRYERRAAPLDGRVGVSGISPECVGGNLRGTCAGANLDPQYQHSEETPFGGRAGPK